jgi:hypothetical protein
MLGYPPKPLTLTGVITMVIKYKSRLYKLLALMPIHVSPYQMNFVRYGSSYTDYVAVTWRKY